MKVLLDTNVLASAAVARGLCTDVLREVLAKHELVVCQQILAELRRILRDKFRMPNGLVRDYIDLLQQDSIFASSDALPKLNIKDKDDLGILAAAQSGCADILVTGDKELQHLEIFSNIKIVSPRQFWQQLTG